MMDVKSIVEQVLQTGQQLAEQGKSLAADKLGVPEESSTERDAMVAGLGKGALAGGVLALLLGTKLGRRLSGKALKYGSLAALGTVAYKAYQNHQQAHGNAPPAGTPVGELDASAAERRSKTLLKAMVGAAKADGHVDATERAAIQSQLQNLELGEEAAQLIHAELDRGLDIAGLANEVDGPTAAAEVYLASRMILDVDNVQERDYLTELASALQLPEDLVEKLEAEI